MLEAYQHFGEQLQLVRGFVDGCDHCIHALAQAVEEQGIDEEDDQEEVAQKSGRGFGHGDQADLVGEQDDKRAGGGYAEHGEHGRDGTQPAAFEQRRRLAPRRQRRGVDAGSRVFGEHGQFFAQIQARAQLIHGAVTRLDDVRGGGSEEPARQRILTDMRARGREQFE